MARRSREQRFRVLHGEQYTREASEDGQNSSELRWQKPTGEETSTRRGECIYSRGEFSQIRNGIKAHSFILEHIFLHL